MTRNRAAGLLAAPIILFLGSLAAAADPEKEPVFPDNISFELSYRSFDGTGSLFRWNNAWGFGAVDAARDRFTRSFEPAGEKARYVHNRNLGTRPWACVDFSDGAARTLYFDVDGDGALSPGEMISPLPGERSKESAGAFVTPDFTVCRADGREVPYRMRLNVQIYGEHNNFFWYPACLWRGEAVLDGGTASLTLFDRDVNGSFLDHGTDGVMLDVRGADGSGEPVVIGQGKQALLSSVVRHGGRFYRLEVEGRPSTGGAFGVRLERITTPCGRVQVKVAARDDLKPNVRMLEISGADDADLVIDLAGFAADVPAGSYRLDRAFPIRYEGADGEQWQMVVHGGPAFTVGAGETATVHLGKPKVRAWAVETGLCGTPGETRTVRFPADAEITVGHEIRGMSGELYENFLGNWRGKPPRVRLVDPDGTTIVDEAMKAG